MTRRCDPESCVRALERPFRALGLAACFALAGCQAHDANFEYRFLLRVEADQGEPLAGAVVRLGDKVAGTSNAEGVVPLRARGTEGSALGFQVSCPDGYRSPSLPVSILLRRVAERNRFPEYRVSCPPLRRTLVVAVRADQGPNLPVLRLGREVGRTDAKGAAHVLVETVPEETVELTLDTSSSPRLRPHNPSARFRVGQTSELVVFHQPFTLERPKGGGRRVAAGPVRIR